MKDIEHPSLQALFAEFSLTQSPFERWKLFKYLSPSDAMLIYMPGQSQSGLCVAQELIHKKLTKGTDVDKQNASIFLKWLTNHRVHLIDMFKTCKPSDFWHDISFMTSGEIKEANAITQDLFIVFNMNKLSSSN